MLSIECPFLSRSMYGIFLQRQGIAKRASPVLFINLGIKVNRFLETIKNFHSAARSLYRKRSFRPPYWAP